MDEADVDEDDACDRCGSFAELRCYDQRWLCPACVERLSAVERDSIGVSSVLSGTLFVVGRVLLPAWAIAFVVHLPHAVAVALVPELLRLPYALLGLVYGLTIGVLSTGATLAMARRAIRGEPLEPVRCLTLAAERWWRLCSSNLRVQLVTMIYFGLLIVPGIVRGLSLLVAVPVAFHEGFDAGDALDESTRRMRGHRSAAFIVAILLLGVAFVLGVAVLTAIVLVEQSFGPSVALTILAQSVFLPGAILVTCLMAVLYAKTSSAASSSRLS